MSDRSAWTAALPAVVERLAHEWTLEVGAPFDPPGETAWVASARDRAGTPLVLKVMWAHPEALHEPDGLRVWAGDGAVRLHASEAFDDTIALLLERCVPGTPLSSRPGYEQDTVLAGLLHRLWSAPTDTFAFRPLQDMCDWWANESEPRFARAPGLLDPGLVRAGLDLFRDLPRSAPSTVLLCTDLHAGNVLAAQREPWLMIDPKPYVGDPAYDVLQHLLNNADRLHADPLGLAGTMAELLDLDRERVHLWLFARCVQEAPQWPGLAEVARTIAPA